MNINNADNLTIKVWKTKIAKIQDKKNEFYVLFDMLSTHNIKPDKI